MVDQRVADRLLRIGGAWGKPDDGDLSDQYAAEIFYRLQVSPDNQLTLGYQLIFDPVFDPDRDVVGVFEIRWRVTSEPISPASALGAMSLKKPCRFSPAK